MSRLMSDQANFLVVSKKLFSLAIPMAMTQLIAVGSSFLCMVIIAKLGREVLAASALIFSVRISMMIIGASILFSLSILIGHAYGEKEYTRVGNFVRQGWLMAIFISIPVMLLFWHIDSILMLFRQPISLIDIIKIFFHANIWNVIPFLLSICNQQLCYATRKQKIDLLANIAGVIVLLSSVYIFVFGKLGFPKLGVAGLGYAMDLQGWFYFLLTSLIIYFNEHFKRFELFKYRFHQNWHDFIRMLQIGWPISLQIGGEMLSLFAGAAMVGWLGANALAAYQVVMQYIFLSIIPLFALSQASGVLISYARGEKNYSEIKKLGTISIVLTLYVTLLVAATFLLMPRHLASLYLNISDVKNSVIIKLIILLFAITAFSQILDGLRNTLTGMLRGMFDTKFPMLISILSIWMIGIPLGYFLGFIMRLGVGGIAVGSAIGMLTGVLLLYYRWRGTTKHFLESKAAH